MPTPAEQKALAFVSLVILLGGAVRVVRAGALAPPAATVAEQQALTQQATAASSVAVLHRNAAAAKGQKQPRGAPKRRYAGAKFDSTGVLIEGTGVVGTNGFPPPGPRIDVDVRAKASPVGVRSPAAVGRATDPSPERAALVDLDVADAAEIERLPRIGPELARRIVANRDSLGPFGALSGLRRVKGMGPATVEALARLVTFSGQARR